MASVYASPLLARFLFSCFKDFLQALEYQQITFAPNGV
jgi:hypothetical protein